MTKFIGIGLVIMVVGGVLLIFKGYDWIEDLVEKQRRKEDER